jgi:hypothetical protein
MSAFVLFYEVLSALEFPKRVRIHVKKRDVIPRRKPNQELAVRPGPALS